MNSILLDILKMTRNHDTAPSMAHVAKLAEELGEVAEAILVDEGYKDKKLKEELIGEVADVMNTSMALLTSYYQELTPEEILQKLKKANLKKGMKYAKKLGTELGADD